MKTADGIEYHDGMTLYGECLGEVTVRPTKRASRTPGYADGDPNMSVFVAGHYAHKEPAFVEATNYWLKVLNQAREKLSQLNKERSACFLGQFMDPSLGKTLRTTEPAATVSVNPAAKSIDATLSTSGS